VKVHDIRPREVEARCERADIAITVAPSLRNPVDAISCLPLGPALRDTGQFHQPDTGMQQIPWDVARDIRDNDFVTTVRESV
jgi:hypothetical protein